VWEGVVLGHRVHVDALRDGFALSGPARLTGGAARSGVWSQMFADARDMEIEVPDCAETGARGAALLAALGAGVYSDLDEAANTVTIARRYCPVAARTSVLNDAYGRFVSAASSLDTLWSSFG
jgi:L-xylulokinase